MSGVRAALREVAEETPYERSARAFLDGERWDGDPVLLVADAAASSTGQGYYSSVKPAVEAFRDEFRESGRVDQFGDVAALDVDEPDLEAVFGAERKRRILVEAAERFADRDEDTDLESLQAWAVTADPYRHDGNPIGAISGVGPSTLQYLRQLAGVDAVRPDEHARRLVEAIADDVGDDDPLPTGDTTLHILAACEWLAVVTAFRRIEIDRIAWWTFADETERKAAMEAV